MPSLAFGEGVGAGKKWNILIIGYLKGVGRMATHVRKYTHERNKKGFTVKETK